MSFHYRLCCNRHPCVIDGETMFMCQHTVPARPMDLRGNWAFEAGARLKEITPVYTRKWGFIPAYERTR